MSDIVDIIQGNVEQNDRNKINSIVAILVAFTATFMALCNVKDGNIVQAMSQAQAHSIDAWAYYQAKSTKEAMAENSVELSKIQKVAGGEILIQEYETQIAKYGKEKAVIKAQAEGF